jgi:DNA-binding transcriptional regulator YhcF (GntR family)
MTRKWSQGKSIYLQIMDEICGSIASGELKPGQRVPAVREYADIFEVNPNTMQRALYELERDGILVSQRNTGRFVTEDVSVLQAMKAQQAEKAYGEFVAQMKALGYSEEEMLQYFFTKTKGKGEAAC